MATTFVAGTKIKAAEINANFDEKLNKVRTVLPVTASGATTTMTNASDIIYLTGAATDTVKLPDATTCYVGQRFTIINWTSSYFVNVQTSVAASWDTIYYDTIMDFIVVDTTIQNGFRSAVRSATKDMTVGTVEVINGRVFFPATQNGSSNANCLDDYSQENWTPRIDGTTLAGVGTYSSQYGRLTKIGDIVIAQGVLIVTAHTGTGNMNIEGFPYTIGDANWAGNVGYLHNCALTAANVLTIYGVNATSQIAMRQYPSGGGAATNVAIDTAFSIFFSIIVKV